MKEMNQWQTETRLNSHIVVFVVLSPRHNQIDLIPANTTLFSFLFCQRNFNVNSVLQTSKQFQEADNSILSTRISQLMSQLIACFSVLYWTIHLFAFVFIETKLTAIDIFIFLCIWFFYIICSHISNDAFRYVNDHVLGMRNR